MRQSSFLCWRFAGFLGGCVLIFCLLFPLQGLAHQFDDRSRIALISAYSPEIKLLQQAITEAKTYRGNGIEFITGVMEGKDVVLFLSGVSIVNAAMNTQFALERFNISHLIFSGIAGGVDSALNLGDVVVADRWGQYLEVTIARQTPDGWVTPSFFSHPFANYGMMFPRMLDVYRAGAEDMEEKFWFDVDPTLLKAANTAAAAVTLKNCTADDVCLEQAPRIVIGGNGVSGGAFVDNAEFREYTFKTFDAQVLDMESAALAHVAYTNNKPFIVFRSLSDLAGGEQGSSAVEIFFQLAADNSALFVREFLKVCCR